MLFGGDDGPIYIPDDAAEALEFLRCRVVARLSSEGLTEFDSQAVKLQMLRALALELHSLKNTLGRKQVLKRSEAYSWVAARALQDAERVHKDEHLILQFTQLFDFFGKLSLQYVEWLFRQRSRLEATGKGRGGFPCLLANFAHKIYLLAFLSLLFIMTALQSFFAFRAISEAAKLPPRVPLLAIPQIKPNSPNLAA